MESMNEYKSKVFTVNSLESAREFADLCEFGRMYDLMAGFIANSVTFHFMTENQNAYTMFVYNGDVMVGTIRKTWMDEIQVRFYENVGDIGDLIQIFTYSAIFLATYWFHND